MPRRIFVALPVSKALEEQVALWRVGYRNLPVRWLTGKNMHVTIIPPWEEEQIEPITDLLETLQGTIGAFALDFERVTYGPNRKEPRLIWAEGETPDQIFTLKHNIERTLSQTPEIRPFRLHMTLARFAQEEFKTFPVQELKDTVAWNEPVNSFVLMESRRSPQGADYEVLSSFRL